MSELTRRILFAVIAAPLAIVAIYVGDAPLAAILSVVAALGAWEICRIARAAGADPLDGVAIVCAALIPLLVLGVYTRKLALPPASIPTIASVAMLAIFASAIFVRGVNRRPLLSTAVTIFGIAYVSMVAFVYVLRYHNYVVNAAGGTALVMLPILLTWSTDIGAYAFGRMFGTKKLIPSVSPGKTVAGAIGGLAVAIVVCWLYRDFVLLPYARLSFTTTGLLLFAVAISVVAQLGDLAESLIKREAGVKDSSQIIPGHGGILDRLDSLFFVLPVSVLLLNSLLVAAPH